MKNNKIFIVTTVVLLLISLYMLGDKIEKEKAMFGSIQDGQAYTSTTTYSFNGAPLFGTTQVLKSYGGTLGSVVITGAVAGAMKFYDATSTTDVSSTTIAVFPASTAAGTYVFDVAFSRGLIVGTTAALAPTTTITYR